MRVFIVYKGFNSSRSNFWDYIIYVGKIGRYVILLKFVRMKFNFWFIFKVVNYV